MSFLGVNPRRNPLLDTLRRPVAELRGIPAPYPTGLADVAGDEPPLNVLEELARRLTEPRANRSAVMQEMRPKLMAQRLRVYGTTQPHVMLQFQDQLFVAFAPELMPPPDRGAFLTHWRIRGLVPANIEATKEERRWSYRLIAGAKFV
jgi:hypothetical protein